VTGEHYSGNFFLNRVQYGPFFFCQIVCDSLGYCIGLFVSFCQPFLKIMDAFEHKVVCVDVLSHMFVY
jgi:hypothetical protein